MSAYNLVQASAVCPSCKQRVPVVAQFKYGHTRQNEYQVGDHLHWGPNGVGTPNRPHVVVDAIAESACPNCGYDGEWNLYAHVEYDRVTNVETATGEHDFVGQQCGYIDLGK